MPHLVLLGDSVFDNGSYVPGRPAVIAAWATTRKSQVERSVIYS